jgi:transposase InsO family protein
MESHLVPNEEVVMRVVEIKLNPDLPNWYRLITVTLKIRGYYINHKKVFRLMKEHLLLEDPRKRKGREFVTFRRVCPAGPLCILEMDIKYVWIYGQRRFAFVLTVLDTFTRYVLHWAVGYSMKGEQVKDVWEYLVAEYLQPHRIAVAQVQVEVRSDNGKQLGAKVVKKFFEENHIRHVFTHPYTPEENGHVESFHSILSDALHNDRFTNLSELELRLDRFYASYTDDRSHSGTRGIPPAKFWSLYEMDLVKVTYLDDRSAKIDLKIPYQDILTLPGIDKYDYRVMRAGGRPSPYFEALDGPKNNNASVGLHNTFESTSV